MTQLFFMAVAGISFFDMLILGLKTESTIERGICTIMATVFGLICLEILLRIIIIPDISDFPIIQLVVVLLARISELIFGALGIFFGIKQLTQKRANK
ncbi:MAG: hypothetical protein WCG55_01420 [bacterium]